MERVVIEYKCDLCDEVVVTDVPLPEGWVRINNPVPDYGDSKRDCFRHVCVKCLAKLSKVISVPQLHDGRKFPCQDS